jgi:hypothetical protein
MQDVTKLGAVALLRGQGLAKLFSVTKYIIFRIHIFFMHIDQVKLEVIYLACFGNI